MKELAFGNAFRRDLKLCRKRGVRLDRLDGAIDLLRADTALPVSYHSHKLQGKWRVWECHILPDLLLIYDFDEASVTLIRLGSHSDFF